MEQVLHADNPLAEVFDTSFEDNQWIQAERFLLDDPEDIVSGDNLTLWCKSTPFLVRVIDKSTVKGVGWWRVLLPGCGEVWVSDIDATVAASPSDDLRARNLLDVKFDGIVASNVSAVASYVQLISDSITNIEVETVDSLIDGFDMTDWMLAVLRSCTHLKSLKLPWNAEITNMRRIAEAAEDGSFQLRSLSLNYTFFSDDSDIIEFLGVLSDTSHPLTRRLEHFRFTVSDALTPGRDFAAAWHQMLAHNRTLHTISLQLWALKDVDESDEEVAIRTGPLALVSKLAFLSTLQDHAQLDTGVTAIIFAFAAEHRVREVFVRFDWTGEPDELEQPTGQV